MHCVSPVAILHEAETDTVTNRYLFSWKPFTEFLGRLQIHNSGQRVFLFLHILKEIL